MREQRVTNLRLTGFARLLTIAAVAALAAGCGGNKRSDTYARASDVQGDCCQHLSGSSRDSCLSQVVRIDDRNVATSSANQSTYACVVDNFVCDPGTGKPTQPSAQAQLECIQDLQ